VLTRLAYYIPSQLKWIDSRELSPRTFLCGYCSAKVGSANGYEFCDIKEANPRAMASIYICPNCLAPTYLDTNGLMHPGAPLGEPVEGVPVQASSLYEEARRCAGVGANTAAVMLCRKLLMHIAVGVGAPENRRFVEYVDYLVDKAYVPASAKQWVDYIRNKGNEANHEIVLMTPDEAKHLLQFCAMLLKLIYEFPSKLPLKGKD